MPSAYNPADDLEGITTAFHAHLDRRQQRDFNARKTPENGFPFPCEAPTLWVKFDIDAPTIIQESEMHAYVYSQFQSLDGFRIPQIHRIYTLPDNTNGDDLDAHIRDFPWGLVVMDYVQATRLIDLPIHKQDLEFQIVLAERIASLLVTMTSLKPPKGSGPGPANGKCMSSIVWGFDEFVAPRSFDTVQQLQDYINVKVKSLCLCYGDFNEGNFLLDDPTNPQSTITVIDFEHTNWLPISFFLWEVYKRDYQDGPFSVALQKP